MSALALRCGGLQQIKCFLSAADKSYSRNFVCSIGSTIILVLIIINSVNKKTDYWLLKKSTEIRILHSQFLNSLNYY